MSLKLLILIHLKSKYPNIVHKGELGRLAIEVWDYEAENMGRRCRELVEAGWIKRIPDSKGRVMYQYIPEIIVP